MRPVALGEQTAAGSRARVLFGRLLSDRDCWELIHGDSVAEILAQLRKCEGYRRELADLPGDTHRSGLETRLEGIPFREAARLRPALTGRRRAWIDSWIALHDAELLKSILRRIYTGQGRIEHLRARALSAPRRELSWPELLAAESFEAVLEALRETDWPRLLRDPLKAAKEGKNTLFPVEMAIDGRVLTQLLRRSLSLTGRERGSLADLFGTETDLLNLTWTLRGLRHFGMGFEDMVNRLLPIRHRISFDQLRRLGRSRNRDESETVLGETPYAEIFIAPRTSPKLPLEKRIQRFLRRKALTLYRKGFPSLGTLGAYLFLRRQEIDDLKMIVEDVRYDYDRRDAVLFLTRPLVGGGDPAWH